MPLDWALVKKRYKGGMEVPTVAGGKTLTVTGCDDEAIYIRESDLESAVEQK